LIYHYWKQFQELEEKCNKSKVGEVYHEILSSHFYRNDPIYKDIIKIRDSLKELAGWDDETFKQRQSEHGEGYIYYTLMGCYPLFGQEAIPWLIRATKLRYNDAQDNLMFSLYQYDPIAFFPILKDILIYWHETENIEYCNSTGMISQLEHIMKKYKFCGKDLRDDPELSAIFIEHDVSIE
jgi:hypothetical protein